MERRVGGPVLSSELEHELAGVIHASSLHQVLQWAFALSPPRDVTEVIVQDEYTHDVVIAIDERIHLVFDTT